MNKTIIKAFFVAATSGIILFLAFGYMVERFVTKESTLKVGQTWLYVLHKDDPFQKPDSLYDHIINLRGDYVQYIQYTHNYSDTQSEKKGMFTLGSELITTKKMQWKKKK